MASGRALFHSTPSVRPPAKERSKNMEYSTPRDTVAYGGSETNAKGLFSFHLADYFPSSPPPPPPPFVTPLFDRSPLGFLPNPSTVVCRSVPSTPPNPPPRRTLDGWTCLLFLPPPPLLLCRLISSTRRRRRQWQRPPPPSQVNTAAAAS